MMVPGQLSILAAEAVTLGASYIAGQGWHLKIAIRAQGESWGDDCWTHYDHLSTTELLQVIDDHLSSRL